MAAGNNPWLRMRRIPRLSVPIIWPPKAIPPSDEGLRMGFRHQADSAGAAPSSLISSLFHSNCGAINPGRWAISRDAQ